MSYVYTPTKQDRADAARLRQYYRENPDRVGKPLDFAHLGAWDRAAA